MNLKDPKDRKATPVFSGVLKYFPDAIREVARCSKAGNDQHHPDTPLHWDRAKSTDELDALTRHLLEAGTLDTDGIRHSTKVAWRSLANLQKEIELDRAVGYEEEPIEDYIERMDATHGKEPKDALDELYEAEVVGTHDTWVESYTEQVKDNIDYQNKETDWEAMFRKFAAQYVGEENVEACIRKQRITKTK